MSTAPHQAHKINIAIIGSNFIVDTFLKAAVQVPSFNFYAIYSRQRATGEEKVNQFLADNVAIENQHRTTPQPDIKVFTDLTLMLADKDIDAVYIASPNSFHTPQAIACLSAGKHVLGEKPSAVNCAELDKILTVAKNNNCCYMEALMSLHVPNFAVLKQHLPRIGTPRKYFGQYCQYSSRYSAVLASLAKQKETGISQNIPNTFLTEFANGALMDIGIYPLYPVIALWGKPLSISAQAVLLETGVDGAGDMQLSYGDKLANISYSKICNGENYMEFQGELGRLRVEFISLMTKVELFLNDGGYEDLSNNDDNSSFLPMSYEIAHFIELVMANKNDNKTIESPTTHWKLSKQVLGVIDEARKQIGVNYPTDI
jgi:predicted dehydrogenase